MNGLWLLGKRYKTRNIYFLVYSQLFKYFYWRFPSLIPRLTAPIDVDVELTNMCNLACPHCHGRIEKRPTGYMNRTLFINLVEEMNSFCFCHLHLCGLGEPAMHPDFDILMCDLSNKHLKVSITTNGLLFDRFEPQKILDWNIDIISVSIDGLDENSYYLRRSGGDYKRLRVNIEHFYEIRKQQKKKYPLLRIANVLFPDSSAEGDIERFRLYWLKCSDMVAFTTLIPLEPELYGSFEQCPNTFFGLDVRWDGRVPTCGYHLNEWIGNANCSSLKEIFSCDSTQKLQMAHLRRDFDAVEFCKRCFVAQEKVSIANSHRHSKHANKYLSASNFLYRKLKIGVR